MSTLGQIQADFQDYVLGRTGATGPVAAHVADQFGMRASQRLAIYFDAYRRRMRTALNASFAKTRSFIGDAVFDRLADDYVAEYPSLHANLRWYGEQFAAFAARTRDDCPIIGELAALEWTLGIAFDAPDSTPITAADLVDLPAEAWGTLLFATRPAVQLLTLKTNAGAWWQSADEEPSPPPAMHIATPQAWLVWRLKHQTHLRPLDTLEARALMDLAGGATFADVCEGVAGMTAGANKDDIESTQRVAGYLQTWLAQGLLGMVR